MSFHGAESKCPTPVLVPRVYSIASIRDDALSTMKSSLIRSAEKQRASRDLRSEAMIPITNAYALQLFSSSVIHMAQKLASRSTRKVGASAIIAGAARFVHERWSLPDIWIMR